MSEDRGWRESYGWEVLKSVYGPRGIIAEPEIAPAGNLVLRVGHEHGGSWQQTEHVVLTPDEAEKLVLACIRALSNDKRLGALEGNPLGGLARSVEAWEQISEALDNNAKGDLSAADVCAVGFSLQEQLAKAPA